MSSPATSSAVLERWRSLRNVFANWGAFVVSVAVNLALSPFIVHTLGNTGYGAWVLLGSLVGYLGLLDLGVRGAVTKYVATYNAAGEHKRAGEIASAALFVFGCAGLLAMGVAGLLSVVAVGALDIPEELREIARIVLIVGGVNVAVSLVSGVFGGIVVAMQRFDYLNGVTIGVTLLRAALIVLALRAGGGLVALALIQLLASLVQGGAGVWLARSVYPGLRVSARSWSAPQVRTIFSYGVSSSLLHAAGAIVNYSDALVIGAFLPVALITFFAIGATLTDYARSVISGISQVLTPMAGALDGLDEKQRLSNVLLTGVRFSTLAVLPMVVTFLLRGGSFIGLWMGPDYAEASGDVLLVLAVPLWAYASFQACTTTMMGINRHRGLVPIFFVEALCNVAISILLIGSYGIMGVAWGTAIPRLVVSLICGPVYAWRQLRVAVSDYWIQGLLRPTLSMLPFAAVTHLMEQHWPATNLLLFFTQVLLALPVAGVGAWFFALKPEERSLRAGGLAQSEASGSEAR